MLKFITTERIEDFRPVLDGLYEDFGNAMCHTVLVWCNEMKGKKDDDCHWQVWLIRDRGETIGICGLYSLVEGSTEELWLGWFGILPELRSKGYGARVLSHLKVEAKELGCKVLRSYVDKDGKPLDFYRRNGFEVVGKVSSFVRKHGLDIEDFEDPKDYIIEHIINQ